MFNKFLGEFEFLCITIIYIYSKQLVMIVIHRSSKHRLWIHHESPCYFETAFDSEITEMNVRSFSILTDWNLKTF